MPNDVITAVKPEKHGVTLTVNGDEMVWVSRPIWREQPLAEGENLDWQAYKAWLLPRQYPEALNAAVAFLAIRARSVYEIQKKLEQKHYLNEAVEMALYKLEKERLTDDAAFAKSWVANAASRRVGRQRLMRELSQKGVDRETAEAALADMDETTNDEAAITAAQKLLRRYLSEPDEKKAMSKLMAAMARRGYGFDEARRAIEKAIEQERA